MYLYAICYELIHNLTKPTQLMSPICFNWYFDRKVQQSAALAFI
jgi:hypothetical protein